MSRDSSLDLSAPAGPGLDPPGALGRPVTSAQALPFLVRLDRWLSTTRQRLDAVEQAAGPGSRMLDDVTVCLSLWQSANRRYEQLRVAADGGRMLAREELAVSGLIWGRLDDAGATGSVNLVELVQLCVAMLVSLEAGLGLDGGRAGLRSRLQQGRGGMERLRAQVLQIAPGQTRDARRDVVTRLETRHVDLQASFDRGGDVAGALARWESEVASLERDLIVLADQEYDARAQRHAAEARYQTLLVRRDQLRQLAARTSETVTPAPRLAIPDVSVLGEPPAQHLDDYLLRLTRVEQATDQAEHAYRAPLAELNTLQARVTAYLLSAAPRSDPDAAADLDLLRTRLATAQGTRPVPLHRVRALVGAITGYLSGSEAHQ